MSGDGKEMNGVSADTIYTQMCAEMRWQRDRELTVASWFTFLLLGFLGSVVAWKYAAAGSPLGVALERCPSLKWLLAAVPVLLGSFGPWSIAESMRRCRQL